MNKEDLSKIDLEKWYTPREIVGLNIITDKNRKYMYDFVLKAIREKRLIAKDISIKKRNSKYGVYKVRGLNLMEFISMYC
jgi:hypothetical protein